MEHGGKSKTVNRLNAKSKAHEPEIRRRRSDISRKTKPDRELKANVKAATIVRQAFGIEFEVAISYSLSAIRQF
jgi:hypothetical protein